MAYQDANGLVVDGLAGTETMVKLKANAANKTKAASTPAKQESKEEIKLYQPSNAAIKNSTRTVLNGLVNKDPGVLIQDQKE